MNITSEQIKKIWAVARDRDIDAETVRDISQQVSGTASVSGLTKEEAKRVIDRLEGKKSHWQAKVVRPANMATDKQIWKIKQLTVELGWGDNPNRLEAFLLKYTGVAKLEWLPKQKAIGLIDGLKSMVNKMQKEVASH